MFILRVFLLVLCGPACLWADQVFQSRHIYGLGDLRALAVASDGSQVASGGAAGAVQWSPDGAIVRRLETHRIAVSKLVYSADSKVLIAGCRDGSIQTWDATSGKPLALYTEHRMEVSSLAVDAHSALFVTGSYDNTARVWSLTNESSLSQVKVPGCYFAAVALNAEILATADNAPSNRVKIWDWRTGKMRRVLPEVSGTTMALAWLPNGQLAAGGEDRIVRVWDIESGELMRAWPALPQNIASLAVFSQRQTLVAGSWEGTVVAWNYETGEELKRWETGNLVDLVAGPAVGEVTLGTVENRLQIWDPANGTLMRELTGHTSSTITSLAFAPDGQTIVVGGSEAATRLWNRTNETVVREFIGHGAGTSAAIFSPDGQRVLTTIGFPRKAAQQWDAATGQLLTESLGHTDWLMGAAYSRDGRFFATSAMDGTVRSWDAATGTNLHVFKDHQAGVRSVAISPDGRWVAGGGMSADPAARVWDIASGRQIWEFHEEAGTVRSLAFLPDNSGLIVGWADGLVRWFDLVTGEQQREYLPSGFLESMALSPDGELLLIGEGWPSFVARLWDLRTGAILRIFIAHSSPIGAVAFNSRGNWVLTGGETARLWDITPLAARLRIEDRGANFVLSWSYGKLEQASTVFGGWEAVPSAQSPWTLEKSGMAGFYRVAAEVDTQ